MQKTALRCLYSKMKSILSVLLLAGLCVFLSGCERGPRWQIHQATLNMSPDTNGASPALTVPVLLDTKSGNAWALRSDGQGWHWQAIDHYGGQK